MGAGSRVTLYILLENTALTYTACPTGGDRDHRAVFLGILASFFLKEEKLTRSFTSGSRWRTAGLAMVSFAGKICRSTAGEPIEPAYAFLGRATMFMPS
jgi:hypothetical protein